jgi:FkbM family methyltransferase
VEEQRTSGRADGVTSRIEDARAAARKWKGRAGEFAATMRTLSAQSRELKARIGRLEAALAHARRELRVMRHALPSVPLVRQTFGHRLRMLSARVREAAATGHEEQLLRVSAAYRTALASTPASLDAIAHTMVLDGLAWRVPFRIGESSLGQAWIDKQRLPYHGVLQTRDAAGGGIMLDVGANIGRMSIPRVILGDVTRAYCAEPDPVTFACLARNVIDNGLRGLVLPDQTAIGDGEGTVRLLRAGPSGNFRVVPGAPPDADSATVDVPSCTLDTWVERLAIDLEAVTFIKVDVEGFERRVLKGARRVLAHRHIAWQMEIHPAKLRAAGDDPRALQDDLQRAFTHFVDLNRRVGGRRVRAVTELPDALQYIEPNGKTDVLLCSSPNPMSALGS